MQKKVRKLFFRLVLTAYVVFLFVMSLKSYSVAGGIPLSEQVVNNAAHIPAYALLTFFLWTAGFGLKKKWLIVFPVAYGGLMEIFQYFSPDRYASWLDFGLNTAGVFLMIWILKFLIKSNPKIDWETGL